MSTIAKTALLYTAEQSRQCDKQAIATGIAGFELMQRAALAAFKLIQQKYSDKPLVIICGGGNNGGDGVVIATLAVQSGIEATVYLLAAADTLRYEAAQSYRQAIQAGVNIVEVDSADAGSAEVYFPTQGLVVDALLGTGLTASPRDPARDWIQMINHSGLPVMAIDVPSGLNSDTGKAMGECVQATTTISFIGRKRGLYTADGPQMSGERFFDDLHVPEASFLGLSEAAVMLLSLADLRVAMGARARASHKGDMGHAFIIGGDHGMAGAAVLAARACARLGAGLTTLASRQQSIAALLPLQPEVMSLALDDADLAKAQSPASVLAIGPGLGGSEWAQRLLEQVLLSTTLHILDADALNLLAGQYQQDLPVYAERRVLTPHPGEAGRLLGISTSQVQQDRFAAVKALQSRYGGVIVLKGAGTLVCWQVSGRQHLALCPYGNPGMASGGMGDVLTGMIAAIVAQCQTLQGADSSDYYAEQLAEAVCLAVCLHSQAADVLAKRYGERGLLAGDLMLQARALLNGKEANFSG